MAAVMKFPRRGGVTHYFSIPEASWSAGGTLFFTAKPQPDDDTTDAAAVIDKGFDDSKKTIAHGIVRYQLDFVGDTDIDKVSFAGGDESLTFEGQFTFVPASGPKQYFPAEPDFIETIIYPTIKNGDS